MDYKKYSLEQLNNWMHDAMSCGDATPQEIYDVIIEVVKDNYYTYKKQTSEAYELLSLLNGNGGWTIEEVMKEKEYYEPSMPPWGHSDMEALRYTEEELNMMCDKAASDLQQDDVFNNVFNSRREDKVVKWQLPVEVDGLTGDCFVEFPDDLLDRAGLKEGDVVEWIDRNDGSFELRKVNGTK
jgi:hypothetical protein